METRKSENDLPVKTGVLQVAIKAFSSLFLAALVFPLGAVAAENRNGLDEDLNARTQRSALQENGVNNLAPRSRISRREASNIASDHYEGRVLSILKDNSNNTWRVRMDSEGTVFNVFINANSGAVSGTSE